MGRARSSTVSTNFCTSAFCHFAGNLVLYMTTSKRGPYIQGVWNLLPQVGLDWEMTSLMAALPVQYSTDSTSSSNPAASNGSPLLRRTLSPGQPGGFKARTKSSLSLVSHGDDRSGSAVSDQSPDRQSPTARTQSQPHVEGVRNGTMSCAGSAAGKLDRQLSGGSTRSVSSTLPAGNFLSAGSTGSADGSPSGSPSKRSPSVRRLSPFAADACQAEVVDTVIVVKKDAPKPM